MGSLYRDSPSAPYVSGNEIDMVNMDVVEATKKADFINFQFTRARQA
jgi:hypothetical protein